MRRSAFVIAALLIAACAAQVQSQTREAAAARPYRAVAIAPPMPVADAAFEVFRRQLGETAQKKDRAGLSALVVAQNFFWDRGNRDTADKRKSGIDNLATALGLNNKNSAGWDILFSFTDDPTASASLAHKGALCAPADPAYNAQEFDTLLKATQTDVSDWGYPVSPGIEVHATAQASAAVIDKLGLAFVRVSADNGAPSANFVRVITPAGKAGYVSADAIAPFGNDQICYVKAGDGWKIGGYVGGGESQ
ncbi:MAG TPA: hypothetical protein VGC38_03780 [Pseudolabrys sp.]